MPIFESFGLTSPPFSMAPDLDRFFLGPSNEEAWCSLRYLQHVPESGCLLLASDGCGKTLHLRSMLDSCAIAALWINGCDCDSGEMIAGNREAECGILSPEAPFARLSGLPRCRLIVVDNATLLPTYRWIELFGAIDRAERDHRRIGLLAACRTESFGELDPLVAARLRSRCLRHVLLPAFDRRTTGDYVRQRLAWAGGGGFEVFDGDAIDRVHPHTDGNPARIHWLCENAMLEAFGNGRTRVLRRDVEAAAVSAVRFVDPTDGRVSQAAAVLSGRPAPQNGRVAPIRHGTALISVLRNRLLKATAQSFSPEKRRAHRFQFPTANAVVQTAAAHKRMQSEFVFPFNLSRDGVGMIAERNIAAGTACKLVLLDSRRKPTAANASIVHSRAIAGGDGLWSLGLRFGRALDVDDFLSLQPASEAEVVSA
ncbi:MAG: hypothetical protein HZB38_11380 [Planctomycetes bacterium]|nr:hypothetical protein [Planctomycetota bacterium]